MIKLSDTLKCMRAGWAYVDAGEMLSRRGKDRILAGTPSGTAGDPPDERRSVVLSLGTALPSIVMDYVQGACHRLNADLAVLCADRAGASDLLAPYRKVLIGQGTNCQVVELSGRPEKAVSRYLRIHSRAMFIVAGGAGDPVEPLLQQVRRGRSAVVLPVPVVIVSARSTRMAKPEHPPLSTAEPPAKRFSSTQE
jgi:hypothetical protein